MKNFLTFKPKAGDYGDNKKFTGYQGGGRKDEYAEHRGFRAVKLLCMILPWQIHYTFVQT